MNKEHHYSTIVEWTGNLGKGTANYKVYERSHSISVDGKPLILASSDPAFRGDAAKYNPEELFLSSLSSCHMLWYLHFCASSGIVVESYKDRAFGIMEETTEGSGRFTKVILKPEVKIRDTTKKELALELHHKANSFCFIANSCNFSIEHEPVITT